jgi:ribosome-associated translation inhibitor RaiA
LAEEVTAMLIETRAMGFALTDAIQRHVESRVESALGPVSAWVLNVTARVEDVNADRGGIDKRCGLVASLRGRGVAVAGAVNADLYAAVDEAAARLRRSAVRAVKRRTGRERTDAQRPGTLLSI